MAGETTNVVIAGLGGQGIITASDILADAAFRCGLDVKKAEVHGMSQRGGSVTSDVRFGPRVYSPMVPEGRADFLLLMDDTQLDPTRHLLAPDGTVLRASSIDVAGLPTAKALNVAALGLLAAHLRLPDAAWDEAIRAGLPAKLHEANLAAFRAGRAVAGRKA
jgi:indolepyruvate ferredoxin oxidoreductase, beta subunit